MSSRHTSAAGIAFAACFIAALFLVNTPDADSPPARFSSYYGASGNRAHLIAAAGLLSLSALAWVLFTSGLRERVVSLTADRIAGAASAAVAGLLGICAALVAVISVAIAESHAPLPGVDTARFLPMAGYVALTFCAMPLAALTVAAISLDALKADVLPRWLGRCGLAAAVLLLGSAVFFPMFALILWVIAVSVSLARRPLRIPRPMAS